MLLRSGLGFGPRVAVVAVASLLAYCPVARADRAFAPRFSTNASGDITIVGNTLETCQAAVADCVNARGGTGSALNNNNFVMERVNVDHPAGGVQSDDRPGGATAAVGALRSGGDRQR